MSAHQSESAASWEGVEDEEEKLERRLALPANSSAPEDEVERSSVGRNCADDEDAILA